MLIFSKMQGTGNDFIIINCLTQNFHYKLNLLSKFLCNRNFGIGADGVIYIFKSSNCDFKMRIFNKDGTEAEMCGNGIRCMVKYLYDKKITPKKKLKIETNVGPKETELEIKNDVVVNVKVDMGKPIFDLEKIPVYLPENENKKIHMANIVIDSQKYSFNLISMGNPHAVCFCNDLNYIKINKIRTNC